MKKALFIGGTGTISAAVTRLAAASGGWELYLLNRGNRDLALPGNVKPLVADIKDEDHVAELLQGMQFDCVCDFIGFVRSDVERDFRLFGGRTSQYMYLSSASAYQKPCTSHIITEETPLGNPYWQYSRDKQACEEYLMERYREDGFPVTIIRPSHTYDERKIPLSVRGNNGTWQVARRMLEGKPVIIQGDGNSLWTMTHNSDFAKGFLGLMGNPAAVGESYHITSDESLTWNQVYGLVADALGVGLNACHVSSELLAALDPGFDLYGNLLGDKSCSVVFDNSKIKSAVPGYKAEVRFADGIKNTVEHILSHPELQLEDPAFDSWCDKVVAAVKGLEASSEH